MFEFRENRKNIPDEELLADIERVAKKLGTNKLTFRQYDEHGIFSVRNVTARLGKWSEILKKIGQQSAVEKDISTEDLFSNLAEVWTKLGRQPTYRDLRPNISKYSPNPYLNKFGTWNNSLKAFIEFINSGDIDIPESNKKNVKNKNARRTPRNINWRLRAKILIKDSCICQMCGTSPAKDSDVILHVDHIKPWSKGGETVEENLRTLCHKCNIGKSDMDIYDLSFSM